MFGTVHRILYMHDDERYNQLIILRLYATYNETGVFNASKSYMIKKHSKKDALSLESKIKQLLIQKYGPNESGVMPYEVSIGSHLFWDFKEFYADALYRYIITLTDPEEAYNFITKVSKKIEYLHCLIDRLRPNFRQSLKPEKLYL